MGTFPSNCNNIKDNATIVRLINNPFMKRLPLLLVGLILIFSFACNDNNKESLMNESLFKEWRVMNGDEIKGDFIRFYKDLNFVSFDTVHRKDSIYYYYKNIGKYSLNGDTIILYNQDYFSKSLLIKEYSYILNYFSEDSLNFQRDLYNKTYKIYLTLKNSNNQSLLDTFDLHPYKRDTITTITHNNIISLDGTRKDYVHFERIYLCNTDTVYNRRIDIYPCSSFNEIKEIEEADKEFDEYYYMGEYGDQRWIRGIHTKEIEAVFDDYVTYKHFIYDSNKHMRECAHGDEYSYYDTFNSYNEGVLYYEDVLNVAYKKEIDELIADEIISKNKEYGWTSEDSVFYNSWKEEFIEKNLKATRQSNLGDNGLIFNFSKGNNDDIYLSYYYDIKVEIPYSKLKKYLNPPFDKLAKLKK